MSLFVEEEKKNIRNEDCRDKLPPKKKKAKKKQKNRAVCLSTIRLPKDYSAPSASSSLDASAERTHGASQSKGLRGRVVFSVSWRSRLKRDVPGSLSFMPE